MSPKEYRERSEAMARVYARWQAEDARLHPMDPWRRGYRALARIFKVSVHAARRAVAHWRNRARAAEGRPMSENVLYVIASRRRAPSDRRTRYFIECVDGRARLGDKFQAVRYRCADVAAVVAQLRLIAPGRVFIILDDAKRPPRKWAQDLESAPAPHQIEAFPRAMEGEQWI